MPEHTSTAPNIFPVLRYTDAPAAIDWLIQAFGFRKNAVHMDAGDSVAHAEVCVGPSVIGLSSATPPTAENPWSSVRQGIYICVPEIEALYARAQRAGADIAVPIRDMEYGSREFTVRDPEGHLWGFGTYDMGRGAGAPLLFPEIHYRDPRTALRFLIDAFGFAKTLDVPTTDGGLLHAELKLGEGYVLVATLAAAGTSWANLTHLVCAHVSDPDQHFRRARAGGATIVSEPEDTPYGARHYVAKDPEGFVWLFGTYRPQAQ